MRRLLLRAATAIPLLVALVGVAAWARSYFARDVVSVQFGRRGGILFSDSGAYVFVTRRYPVDLGRSLTWEVDGPDRASALRSLVHFEWTRHAPPQDPSPGWYVAAPHWTVPAVFGALPAFSRLGRRRSAARGFPIDAPTPTP